MLIYDYPYSSEDTAVTALHDVTMEGIGMHYHENLNFRDDLTGV